MKQLLFLSLLLAACGTVKNSHNIGNTSTEQVFIADQKKGLPGKCYQQMTLNSQRLWTEVLCDSQISKGLIQQIQTDLQNLNYEIVPNEVSQVKLGPSTKEAIKAFQIKNNMASGGLDWATINRLKGL